MIMCNYSKRLFMGLSDKPNNRSFGAKLFNLEYLAGELKYLYTKLLIR